MDSTFARALSIVWNIIPCSITISMPRPIPITRQANIMDLHPLIYTLHISLPFIPPTMPAIIPIAKNIGAICPANQSILSAPYIIISTNIFRVLNLDGIEDWTLSLSGAGSVFSRE